MAYRASTALPAELREVAIASLKAGAIGAVMVAAFTALGFALPNSARGFDPGYLLVLTPFAFLIAFITGTLSTAVFLLVFGVPLAFVSRGTLASPFGLGIALSAALLASAAFAGLMSEPVLIWLSSPFATAAAFFYRREILFERELD